MGYAKKTNEHRELTYKKADRLLGNRDYLNLRYRTQLIRHYNKTISIRLFDTDIIVFHPDNSFQLYTGGWNKVTTRQRMDQYMPIGHVFSDKDVLYFGFPTKYIFHEGMKVYEDGTTDARPYRFDLFEDVFHTPINSDKDILTASIKMSSEEHYKLWRKRRSTEFRNYFVNYLHKEVLPMILPTANTNEPWYGIALERLQTGS